MNVVDMSVVDWLDASDARKEANIMEATNKVMSKLTLDLSCVLAGYWDGRVFGGD
jgi:hypothetical protein